MKSLAEQLLNTNLSEAESKIKMPEKEVRMTMRDDHGMKYKKIIEVGIQSNSEKNIVLR